MLTIFGLQFHLYGLILGISAVVATRLMTIKANHHRLPGAEIEAAAMWVIAGGIVGARLYHVVTDWGMYASDIWAVFKIWQGGLSIIGAVIGGLVTVGLLIRRHHLSLTLAQVADLSAFALPFAQAIGRLGNWVNQEVVGLPSSLPWAIFLDEGHRPSGYSQYATFHPLFAYEAGLLLIFGLRVWWLDAHQPALSKTGKWHQPVGTGTVFAWYILYYSVIRFSLDFLRVEKSLIFNTIGVNQLVLLIIAGGTSWWLYQRHRHVS